MSKDSLRERSSVRPVFRETNRPINSYPPSFPPPTSGGGLRWGACLILLVLPFLFQNTPKVFPEQAATAHEVEQVLESLNRGSRNLRTLKAFLEMNFLGRGGGRPHDCFGQLTITRDGNLYLKAFDALAPNYFTLAVTQEKFSLFIPKEGAIYTGTLEAIGTVDFQLEINPVDLRHALMPAEITDPVEAIELRHKEGLIELSFLRREKGGSYVDRMLLVDPTYHDRILERVLTPQGSVLLEIERSDFFQREGLRLPQAIRIKKVQLGSETTLRMKKLKWNIEIPRERFELAVPEGIVVEKIGL